MKLQYLCQTIRWALLAGFSAGAMAEPPAQETHGHDYPTAARVEYVNDCISKNGAKLAALYQCSCVIDRIASILAYDDFVETSTYAKYATLPGEGGGIFRDSAESRKLAKTFRDLEAESAKACGLSH